jgi:hypothetical protein
MSAADSCPYPGCGTDVPNSQYACRRHWYALPKDIRDDINDGWRLRRQTGDPGAHYAAMLRAARFYVKAGGS